MSGIVDLVNSLLESSHRSYDQDFYSWPFGSSLETTNCALNRPTVCPIFHLFFLNIHWRLLSIWNCNGSSRHQTSAISSNLSYSLLMYFLSHLSLCCFLCDWPLSHHLSFPLQACACFPTLLPSPSFQILLLQSHPQFPCHTPPYHLYPLRTDMSSLSYHPFPFPTEAYFAFIKIAYKRMCLLKLSHDVTLPFYRNHLNHFCYYS